MKKYVLCVFAHYNHFGTQKSIQFVCFEAPFEIESAFSASAALCKGEKNARPNSKYDANCNSVSGVCNASFVYPRAIDSFWPVRHDKEP